MTKYFVAAYTGLLVLSFPSFPQDKKPVESVTVKEPFITLPTAVVGDVGAFITVEAKTNGAEVKYVAIDSGLNVFPSEQLKNSKNTVVSSMKEGKYRLLAYTALNNIPSKPAICVLVIGNPPEPEPNPGPAPPPAPVKPAGLAGEIYDQIKGFPPDQIKAVRTVVKDRLAYLAGIPSAKTTIVKDIMNDMDVKAKIPKGVPPWSPFIAWLQTRCLQIYPNGTDDEVVIAMNEWLIALEALSK